MRFHDLPKEDQKIVLDAFVVHNHKLLITHCNCAHNKYDWATLKCYGHKVNPIYFVRCYRCDRTSQFADSPEKAVLAWNTELLLDPTPITDVDNVTNLISDFIS